MADLPHDPRARPARGTGSVLVTGATGFLGRRVCRVLADRRVKFRALVRTSSDRSVIEGTDAWMVEGDLTKRETLARAVAGVDVVLHCAGVVRKSDPKLNRDVHVHGTANLLAACGEAGVRRVVAISSDTVMREERDAYAQSKADAEELLARWDEGEVVVLRPPMMLGRGSAHLSKLIALSRLPMLPQGPYRRPVGVDDVAAATVRAGLDLEAPPDAPIDLPGPDQVRFHELIRRVSRARNALYGQVTLPFPGLPLAPATPMNESLARDLLDWDPTPLDDVLRSALDVHHGGT